MKKKCWESITQKVNEVGIGDFRMQKSVKKWIDLTSHTKKAEAKRRCEMSATGGESVALRQPMTPS